MIVVAGLFLYDAAQRSPIPKPVSAPYCYTGMKQGDFFLYMPCSHLPEIYGVPKDIIERDA